MSDQHTGCTKEDLRDLRDQVLDEMRLGFGRTHERLDILNGRIGKNEVETGKHEIRLRNVEKAVFDRRHAEPRHLSDPEQRSVKRRDVTLIIAGGAGLLLTIKFLVWIGPALANLTP